MHGFICIVRFEEMYKSSRLIFGEKHQKTAFDEQVALANFNFAVYTTSNYICRHFLGILKKRQDLTKP